MKHWDYQTDIDWEKFDRSKVDPAIVPLIKAAALVEYNGGQYADHLVPVFADDPDFCASARDWGIEEIQHGQSLGKWASLYDPTFNLEDAFQKFTSGYQIPVQAGVSARGSRAGEMIARCIVETGTSSYYTALMESTDEPVLKDICRHIAADEFRHYKLFYQYFKKYVAIEKISFPRRLMIAIGRISETEDDELSYAYYSGNLAANDNTAYDRELFNKRYMFGAYSYYRRHHIERAVGMVLKATGLKAGGKLNSWLTTLAYKKMQKNLHKLANDLKQAA
ncbi:MAG: ferritin-like domain-containing protein [Alphaproteobacteria bacterium]|nr:MAG: ferritin-like domain-containing protein [Alphaproteobacteria bacterium]